MKRLFEVLGLPIVKPHQADVSAFVKDFIIDIKAKRISAVLGECNNLMGKDLCISFEDIKKIGSDAIIIDEKGNSSINKLNPELKKHSELLGMDVYSAEGELLGKISDLLFQPESGEICALLVSDGIMKDFVIGRKVIPILDKTEFAEDFAILSKECIEEIIDRSAGIKSIFNIEK